MLRTHFISGIFKFAVILIKHHPKGKQSHDYTMTQVPEHHRKQERKSDDCEWC